MILLDFLGGNDPVQCWAESNNLIYLDSKIVMMLREIMVTVHRQP
jgi:hypothetical protein